MNVLVTGFEPFGNRLINNSWEIAKAYKGNNSFTIVKLPVSFSRAHKEVINQIRKQPFDLIIMLGEASSSKDNIRLERIAINFKDSRNGDNDGIKPDEEILIKDAPAAYFTKFPVKKTADELKESGYAVKVSNSAGTYVCNSLYFHVLHYIATSQSNTDALFVHVPSTTQIISLEEMKNTLDAIIKLVLSHKG